MTDELMSEIKVPRTDGSIITVVGVGGAGGNAVNHMWNLGIRGVTLPRIIRTVGTHVESTGREWKDRYKRGRCTIGKSVV